MQHITVMKSGDGTFLIFIETDYLLKFIMVRLISYQIQLLLLIQFMLLISLLAANANGQKIELLPGMTLLQKIGLTVAIGGALTVGGVYLAARQISIGGKYLGKSVINAAQSAGKALKNSFYFLSSPFRTSEIPEQLKQRVLPQQQIESYFEMVSKEVAEHPDTLYVLVKELNSSQSKVLNTMVASFDREDTLNKLLLLCREKWKGHQHFSSQIFSNKVLVLPLTPLKDLKKNEIGVIELEIVFMQTFG